MKIELFSMIRDFFHTPPCTMIAAAPKGSPPRRIWNKQFKKTLPDVPLRGPEAGFPRVNTIFMVQE